MNYRETYNEISRNVSKEINEIAKLFTEKESKEIQFTVTGSSLLGDYDLILVWYEEETDGVYFKNNYDESTQSLDDFDLDTKIDILDYLKSLS